MLGLFFLWVLAFLLASPGSMAEDQNPKSCFLYPVTTEKSSLPYKIAGNGEHFVTVNRISIENAVWISDQGGECVVVLEKTLKECTAERKGRICRSSYLSPAPADDDYITLVFRRQKDKLTVYRRHSLAKEIVLDASIETLTVRTCGRAINIAFDCPGSCYSFENAVVPMSLEEGSPRAFPIYGRLKPSADNKILTLKARGENDESVSFELEEQNSKLTSDDWSLLTFTANVVRTNTSEPYNLTLTVDSDWKINRYKTLKLPTTNLYLDFSGTANVIWALTCQPDREASVPDNDCTVYRQLYIVSLFALAILATALFVTAFLLCKHWDHRKAVTSPSPGTAVPETHDYDYVDLAAVSQLAEGERYQARNGLARQPTTRSPVANINTSAFDYDAAEFQVRAGEATRQKLLTSGDIRLVVETDILLITLLSAEGRRIARWSVEHIRRFSYSDKEFRFEAGRKSVHGTGLFNFITSQGGQIHDLLQQHVQLLLDPEATTGREAHCHPTSGQTPADDDDGYEIPIPLTFADDDDGYEIPIPLTFAGKDDGYEIPQTSEEHIYEVIPDIPNKRV